MDDIELSDEETRRLVAERLATASSRVSMLIFIEGESETPESVNNNGTVSFVQLPGGRFLITNQHVWDHFRNRKAKNPKCKVALTGHGITRPVDISDLEVVAECATLDLCVLTCPDDRLVTLNKQFCRIEEWPPQRAIDGDDISVTGFPGVCRGIEAVQIPELGRTEDALRHESVILYLKLIGPSDRKALLGFTSPNPEVIQISNKPPKIYRWNGMSGSLTYRLDRRSNLFKPCGILHSAGEGKIASLSMTHLDFVQANGTIACPN